VSRHDDARGAKASVDKRLRVVAWEFEVAYTTASANAAKQVATPLPAASERLVARIVALDGTWHRPFTTLELADLQGLIDVETDAEPFALEGRSDSAWRERIGNAVPSPAAQAIAEVMGRALLLAWQGETFELSATTVWVRPMVVAVSVEVPA
jgi:site-specific DNA-cytosine methylase